MSAGRGLRAYGQPYHMLPCPPVQPPAPLPCPWLTIRPHPGPACRAVPRGVTWPRRAAAWWGAAPVHLLLHIFGGRATNARPPARLPLTWRRRCSLADQAAWGSPDCRGNPRDRSEGERCGVAGGCSGVTGGGGAARRRRVTSPAAVAAAHKQQPGRARAPPVQWRGLAVLGMCVATLVAVCGGRAGAGGGLARPRGVHAGWARRAAPRPRPGPPASRPRPSDQTSCTLPSRPSGRGARRRQQGGKSLQHQDPPPRAAGGPTYMHMCRFSRKMRKAAAAPPPRPPCRRPPDHSRLLPLLAAADPHTYLPPLPQSQSAACVRGFAVGVLERFAGRSVVRRANPQVPPS